MLCSQAAILYSKFQFLLKLVLCSSIHHLLILLSCFDYLEESFSFYIKLYLPVKTSCLILQKMSLLKVLNVLVTQLPPF